MATDILKTVDVTNHDASDFSVWPGIKRFLEPAASLKVTVVLFALSIFLILAGTFAQVDKDIWEVIGTYFRVWMVWVPLQVFFPPSFSPDNPIVVGGVIPFPGGKLLGLLLAINLVSAHLVRFKAVAKGAKLYYGLVGIALGCFVTWAIVAAGGNSRGIQGEPWIPYSSQWIGYQGFLAFLAFSAAFGFVVRWQKPLSQSGVSWTRELFLRGLLASTCVGLALLLAWIVQKGDAGRPADASLRILWQLTQGTVASIALLGGCWTVFGKRAGIVLLHGGIGLMMFYELHVALTAIETQMQLGEGERTNYVHDIRTFELAVIDTLDAREERIVAIPKSIFLGKSTIDHPDLPFKVDVQQFFKNARMRSVTKSDTNPATAGIGLIAVPDEAKASTGTDNDSKIDFPAAYVTLLSKSDNKPIGTYLVGMELSMTDQTDSVQVGEKKYRIELRPKRYYKPYVFELLDVQKKDYLGTSTPRSYASTVHIIDPTRNVDEEKTIWMNNPLRFEDETFYQTTYYQEPETGYEHTTLSVVANSGWMMPYVGCMLVGIGMLFHFLNLLVRFLTKGESAELSPDDSSRSSHLAAKLGLKLKSSDAAKPTGAIDKKSSWMPTIFSGTTVACVIYYFVLVATPPKPTLLTFDFYRFGQIPVMSEGRAKPIDSAATSSLLAIAGKTALTIDDEHGKLSFSQKISKLFGGKVVPTSNISAIQWLTEVIADTEHSDEREIFRVENLELQETIGVKKREGMRYSVKELRPNFAKVLRQIELADGQAKKDRNSLSVFQKKVLEFSEKLSTFKHLKEAFGLQNRIGGKNDEQVIESFQMAMREAQNLEEHRHPVFAVGPTSSDESWHVYSRAWMLNLVNRIQNNGNENQAVVAWEKILKAFSEDKPAAFNEAVDQYLKEINEKPPQDVKPWVIRLESYINYSRPFIHAGRMYLVAFIAGALGWLFWPRGFNRAAFSILLVTFVVHSLALWARLVISGRPPVTNLYSSAVFIGWGCVLMGLLFEIVYGIGIGNLVAAVAGYATLLIADGLAADGDTFTVLQAVLDTQFWLATHVTCITLGYATTYLAGLFGVAYIFRGVFTPSLTVQDGRDINRMIYGTLCFSIFFSFVGTVLGGLWADDSWGRFWGWDPKENAALIIVLWNALALHARWGGMVKERGLAALAVGGNIFVSWSWWGVNALGAGLHSYGFKQGTLRNLGLFIIVNLAIIAVGMLPKNYWWSLRRRATG